MSLSTKIELSISCSKLRNMDVLSKSDPVCVLSFKTGRNSLYNPLGTTEMAKNNLSPNFKKSFQVEYYFEKQQNIQCQVWDIDQNVFKGVVDPKVDQLIGIAEFSLGEICGSHQQKKTKDLMNKKNKKCGQITVHFEEITRNEVVGDLEIKKFLSFKCRGKNLKKMDLFGKSDPYIVLSKFRKDGTWKQAYRSKIIMVNLNPEWESVKIPLGRLVGDNMERKLRLQVFDWDKLTSDDLIGEFEFNIAEFLELKDELYKKEFELVLPKKKKKSKKSRGVVIFERFGIVNEELIPYKKLNVREKFLKYLGDTELSLTIAVDFTGSNGDPSKFGSLHWTGGSHPNQYEEAIQSVGGILQAYDSDNLFPTFGFGGMVLGYTSHCFNLNGALKSPDCKGIDGVLKTYKKAIKKFPLSGPTYFGQVLKVTKKRILKEIKELRENELKYFVLLILTDGQINDMEETINELIELSKLPCSVIITGVGDANFGMMDELDADDSMLSQNGREAERDLVQFVPFRKFSSNGEKLAEETLKEVPAQVVEYFEKRNVLPSVYK